MSQGAWDFLEKNNLFLKCNKKIDCSWKKKDCFYMVKKILSKYAVNLKKTIGRSREGHEDSEKSLVLSGYMLLQVLYVKFVATLALINLRRQINRPNCTISSVLCQIFLQLATLALIQFLATNKSAKLYVFKCCMSYFSSAPYARHHNLRLQINQPNCTISSLVCPVFLRLATLALTVSNFK
jgi:hypothetical protein